MSKQIYIFCSSKFFFISKIVFSIVMFQFGVQFASANQTIAITPEQWTLVFADSNGSQGYIVTFPGGSNYIQFNGFTPVFSSEGIQMILPQYGSFSVINASSVSSYLAVTFSSSSTELDCGENNGDGGSLSPISASPLTLVTPPVLYDGETPLLTCFNEYAPIAIDITQILYTGPPISPSPSPSPSPSEQPSAITLAVDSSGDIMDINGNTDSSTGTPTNSSNCTQCSAGNPVNLANGLMWHELTDFNVPGRTQSTALNLTRTYLSSPIIALGDFGPHWFHNWETRILAASNAILPDLIWVDTHGGANYFHRNSDGSFTNPPGFFGSLVEGATSFTLTLPGEIIYTFSRVPATAPIGRLLSIAEPHGEAVTLSYDSNGNLASLQTGLAGTVSFTRNTAGKIIQALRVRDNLAYVFSYDAQGRLATSQDFAGNTTAYAYTSVGSDNAFLASVTDPLERTITFSFDSKGRSVAQTDLGGATRSFSYGTDSQGRFQTTLKGIDQQTTLYHFNSSYLLVETDLPDGSQRTQTWSATKQLASSTDELGFTTQYGYDSHGNLSSIQKPLDPTPVLITYDPTFDVPTQIVPLAGAPTLTQLNSSTGDILNISRTSGGATLSEILGYDSFGNPTSFNNGRGSYANQTNSNGLLTFVFDTRNPETRTYDSHGRVITRTFATGRILNYAWDNFDRVTQVTDSAGPGLLLTYDVVNRVLSRTVTDGTTQQTTQFQWDARNRLIAKTDALGNETKYQYDQPGPNGTLVVIDAPLFMIDADGDKTLYSYDDRDRLVTTTDAKGGVTQYQYNDRNDRTAVIDPLDETTTFTFDGNDRLLSSSQPSVITNSSGKTTASTEVTNFFYDLSGKLIREEMPSAMGGKSVISYTFDAFDRVVGKTLVRENAQGLVTLTEDSSTFSYEAELDRVLMTAANNGVENLSFSYDVAPPFSPISYGVAAVDPKNSLGLVQDQYLVNYDGTNQIESIVNSNGKTAFSSTHDPAGRLLSITSGNLLGSNITGLEVALSYDTFGRKQSSLAQVGKSKTTSSVAYDLLNRVTSLNWQDSGGFGNNLGGYFSGLGKVEEQLAYDPVGSVLSQTREFGKQSYSYDSTHQLTAISSKGNSNFFTDALLSQEMDRSYQYDLNGNRTNNSIGGASQYTNNEITSGPGLNYSSDQDGFGNVASEVQKGAVGLARNYTYRSDKKLMEMTLTMGSNWQDDPSILEELTDVKYSYDALGRRVAKTITTRPWIPCFVGHFGNERQLGLSNSYTQSYSYLVNQDKILIGKSGDGVQTLYIDGQGIDEHLGEVGPRTTQAYITDHLGSVLNSSIAGLFRSYGAFGETPITGVIVPASYSADPVLYGFAGRQFDLESAKYYNRARGYDPSTGRFLSKDPIGFNGGQTNLYGYVMNDPINWTDPSGLFSQGLISQYLSPAAQGAFAAAEIYIGQFLFRAGLGSSATGIGALPALGLFGGGGLLFVDGIANAGNATQRALSNLTFPFNTTQNSSPLLPFSTGQQQLACGK